MHTRGLCWLLAGLLPACSLVLDGEPVPLRCSQEGRLGPPACDAGMVCRAGVCEAAEAAADITPQGGESSAPGDDDVAGGAGGRGR